MKFRLPHIPRRLRAADSAGTALQGREPQPDTGFSIRAVEPGFHRCTRAQEIQFSRSELPALNLNVGPQSIVTVTASDTDVCSVALRAEVRALAEDEARMLLEDIRLTVSEGTITLRNPPCSERVHPLSLLHITAPRDTPLTVAGEYAAIEVIGMGAPVKISATHAQVKVLGTTGRVDVDASESGAIVFSGEQGEVHLTAEISVDLMITAPQFRGQLDATTQGDIRALFPPGFASGFEATVRSDADFICRARDLAPGIRRHADGRAIFTRGPGQPSVRMASLAGKVVVDAVAPRATGL